MSHSEELAELCHSEEMAAVLLQTAPAVLMNVDSTGSHRGVDYTASAAELFGALLVVALILSLPAAAALYARWPEGKQTWKPRAASDINSTILSCYLLAFCSLALGILGWTVFIEMDYITGNTSAGLHGEAQFANENVIGFAAALYLGPVVGLLTLTATGLMLSQPSFSISEGAKIGWLFLLVAGSGAATVVGAQMCWSILSCGILGCTGEYANDGTKLNGIGLWIFWLSAGFTLVFATILAKRVFGEQAPAASLVVGQAPSSSPQPTLESQVRRQRTIRLAAALSLALVVIPFLWMLTALLPNSFKSWKTSTVLETMAATESLAEDSNSWLKTINIRLSADYNLKAYPDTVLFYGFLEVLALMAAASAACPPLEKLLGSRHHPGGVSLGEGLTLVLFAIMLVFWFVYWIQSHSWHYAKEMMNFPVWEEVFSRTFGLTAVLFMALNMLPACKNSLWHEALGISWERGLWTHRWLGGATVVFMLLHILTMFLHYYEMGTFPYDAVHLHQFYPINHNGVSTAGLPDYDNWTISTQMLVSYPALFIFGVLPLFRNQGWELFKFTHFFFLVLIPSTLVHAESSWYFLIGGIAFYLIDSGVRFVSVTSPTAVLLSAKTYEAEGGVVELQINKAHPFPGQFAWVNVPAVSTWEWHPFSLASSPYDGTSKLCIKNMGKGTFTDKLYQLVHKGDASALTVQLDGAYGPMFDPADHGAFLLIGGGIGITQVHSTLRTLSQMAVRKELPASLKMVRLIWIGRSPELFRVLDDSIGQCLQAKYPAGSPKFSVTLYATADAPSHTSFAAPLKKGRPSFRQIYAEAEVDLAALQPNTHPFGTIFVQACGPAAMVSAAEEAAANSRTLVFDSALFRL
jgi:predicted ferric reductase